MRQMKKKIIIAILVTLLLTAGIAFLISNNVIKGKEEEIAELKTQVADTKCLAFSKELKADSIITPEDIIEVAVKTTSLSSGYYKLNKSLTGDEKQEIEHYLIYVDENGNSQDASEKITVGDLYGRVIKSNVAENTLIMDSILYPKGEEPTKDERMFEFNFLKIPSDLVENEYIDIRIRFPQGEDYSVLIGKKVEKIAGNNTIFIKLNEEEIMTMGSAIIEAYMQQGVSLYANKYTDAATQLFNEKVVDYVAKYEYAVERLIKEKTDLELRRAIAEIIMVDADGNSIMNEDGTIPYRPDSGDVLELEGAMAEEYELSGTINISTTREMVKEENEEGEMEEVEVFYILPEMLEYISERLIEEIEASMPIYTVEDFENEAIVEYAGIKVDHVEAIRLAEADNNTKVLNYYRMITEMIPDEIIRTYPVRKEVLAVIKNNPNLLDTIIAEFDTTALLNTRVDEYYELEKEYEELKAEYEVSDEYTKMTIEQEMETVEKEMKSILNQRVGNVESKLKTEIEAQKAERVTYLESLING